MDMTPAGIAFVLIIAAQFLAVIAVYNARFKDDLGELC
jgi:hypothetical protein